MLNGSRDRRKELAAAARRAGRPASRPVPAAADPLARRPGAGGRRGRARAEGRLEFHDLLVLARDLLRDPPRRPCVTLHDRYQRLLLDEFQDTDPIQIELAVRIAGGEHADADDWRDVAVPPGPLFVVGDPKQSIYRFRRADIATYLSASSIWARRGQPDHQLPHGRADPRLGQRGLRSSSSSSMPDGQPAYEPLDPARSSRGVRAGGHRARRRTARRPATSSGDHPAGAGGRRRRRRHPPDHRRGLAGLRRADTGVAQRRARRHRDPGAGAHLAAVPRGRPGRGRSRATAPRPARWSTRPRRSATCWPASGRSPTRATSWRWCTALRSPLVRLRRRRPVDLEARRRLVQRPSHASQDSALSDGPGRGGAGATCAGCTSTPGG